MENKQLLFFIILFSLFGTLSAQEVVVPAGGDASGSNGSLSYTVGQVVYTEIQGANGALSQGIQYPYTISVVTDTPDGEAFTLTFATYPNPTSNFLILSIEGELKGAFSYILYDNAGSEVAAASISGNTTKIDMSQLRPSIYILRVAAANEGGIFIVKTFKIIKN